MAGRFKIRIRPSNQADPGWVVEQPAVQESWTVFPEETSEPAPPAPKPMPEKTATNKNANKPTGAR